jgi:hypothetical protein
MHRLAELYAKFNRIFSWYFMPSCPPLETPYAETKRRLRALRAQDSPVERLIQELEESCERGKR